MEKAKGPVVGRLHTYWKVLLLARGFDLETTLSPETCAERLQKQHQRYRPLSRFLTARRTAKISTQQTGHSFDLRMRRRVLNLDMTTVHMRGRILYSEGLSTTLIRGTVRLGWLFLAVIFIPSFLLVINGIVLLFVERASTLELVVGVTFSLSMGLLGLWEGRVAWGDYHALLHEFTQRLAAVAVTDTAQSPFEEERDRTRT